MASKSNGDGGGPPATPSENGHKKGESVVHVRADSESTLEDLFQVVTRGNTTQLSVPFR